MHEVNIFHHMYSPENLTVSAGIMKTNSDCFTINNNYDFTQSSFIMQYLLIIIKTFVPIINMNFIGYIFLLHVSTLLTFIWHQHY